jgi:hypothetical protein
LFKRTRYQHGSIEREQRRKGPAVWVYRWWEEDVNGKLVHRKAQVGDVKQYPTESAAYAAADALRLTINNQCAHRSLHRTTINTLWEHYSNEELPLKALSTQDVRDLRQQLDHSEVGQSHSGRNQNRRGRALASINRNSGRNQGQDQVRNVCSVLSRCSLAFALTIPFLRVFRSGLVGSEGRAPECGSAPNVKSLR